ncbi:rhomboid family intramembrane serine protease [Nocardioides sp.]|uniref:rhomboid family intramembrane serine protease n=1 Tax=Nocardioides sp. TaxID=35761 RepID=UPI0039E3FF71
MSSPDPGVPVCYRHPGREAHIKCQRCGRTICPDCMTTAAVGFQCPECVAEGRRTTRSPQAAYGGARVSSATATSFVLIAINAVVWLLINVTGRSTSKLVDLLALTPLGRCQLSDGSYYPQVGAEQVCDTVGTTTWVPGVADGSYWQLLTSAFTHVEIWHILTNMYALWILGPMLEPILGRVRFLAVYLLSALAGSAFVYVAADPASSTVGASGAIFGLMGAALVISRRINAPLRPILVLVVLNAVITILVPGISWQGHVGGFVGGLLATGVLAYAPPRSRTAVQSAGLGLLFAVVAVVAVLRTLALT